MARVSWAMRGLARIGWEEPSRAARCSWAMPCLARVTIAGILVLIGANLGCGGVASSGHVPPSGSIASRDLSAESEVPAGPLAPSGSVPAAPLAMAVDAAPLRLMLPTDPEFLARPLPASAPATRYRERSRIDVGKGYLQQLDLFPGERELLVASAAEASVRVYQRSSQRLLGNYGLAGAERFDTRAVLAWPELGPSGKPCYVVSGADGIALFSTANGTRLAWLDSRPTREMRWSTDRRVLIAMAAELPSRPSTLYVFRREGVTLVPVGELAFEERVDAWDLSRDNRLLALTHYPSGDLRVIDLHTGGDVLRTPGPQYAGDVALAPNGRSVAVGGAGLLVVDLLNADRRAFYSHVFNNIGCVRYSPSGDLLATSAYDGRLRLFRLADVELPRVTANTQPAHGLRLELLDELRHTGHANVYTLTFEADGLGLLSASGDQTVRWFRAIPSDQKSSSIAKVFRTLEQWQKDEPLATVPLFAIDAPLTVDGHYYPRALQEAPRPSRMPLGRYACKITTAYKMRECRVTRNESGHTLLEFMSGNLLELKGIVYDDGANLRFEGWLTKPSPLIDCRGCDQQPILGLLRGGGKRFDGILAFRNYYDPLVPPAAPSPNERVEEALDRYPVELRFEQSAHNGL